MTRPLPARIAATVLALLAAPTVGQQVPLDPTTIPQFVEPLPHFAGTRIDGTQPLTVTMSEFQQQVLPASMYAALPAPYSAGTRVWGYGIRTFDGSTQLAPPHYPGFTIEARRGLPTTIRYRNELVAPLLQQYLRIDQTLHWANPLGMPVGNPLTTPYSGPAPAVAHLHGGETPSGSDGGPDQWFTASGLRGPGYTSLPGAAANEAIFRYANEQEAATLWFHDHALGATRLNVYAGLAAFYLLRDERDCGEPPGRCLHRPSPNLPAGPYEIEVAVQDRMFDTNGQWYFPSVGDNPEHPFWIPEFLGDVIVVNGKTWPYLDVEPRRYRFRFLNGSNARFYHMWLEDTSSGGDGPVFWQIGTDGGLLDRPVAIPSRPHRQGNLLLAPGERADLIVDFRGFAGRTLRLRNDANSPFPFGDPVAPGLTDRILEFRVVLPLQGEDSSFDPRRRGVPLRDAPVTDLFQDMVRGLDGRRLLMLNEVEGQNGPLEALLNNTRWSGLRHGGSGPEPVPGSHPHGRNHVTERPRVGATELWEIANLTGDAHPIHLHLVQFQVLGRQTFDPAYEQVYAAAFPSHVFEPGSGPPLHYADGNFLALGGNPEIQPWLTGRMRRAAANERGWKDTVIAYPGEVTSLIVRFAPQGVPAGACTAGENLFPFDPTQGPGYVWHCHILEHEDNEMMRPLILLR